MSHTKVHCASDQEGLIAELGSAVSLVETGAHIKSAASNALTRDMLKSWAPPKGKFLLHVVAMGNEEKYGHNKNADAFPEEMLRRDSGTFVTHGRFYREHRNRGAHEGIGSIKEAVYNAPMGRTELAVWGNREPEDGSKIAAEKEYQDAKAGKFVDVSMSVKVPHDICSICRNKARHPGEYCIHMFSTPGQFNKAAGKYVYVSNPKGRFFDISSVGNRADRIARSLEFVDSTEHSKAASYRNNEFITGSQWAEIDGIILPRSTADLIKSAAKVSTLSRLAKASREAKRLIASKEKSHAAELVKLAAHSMFVERLSDASAAAMYQCDPQSLFRKLASRKVVLPFADFIAIYGRDIAPEIVKRAQVKLADAMEKLDDTDDDSDVDEDAPEDGGEFDAGSALMTEVRNDKAIDSLMDEATEKFSIRPDAATERVIRIQITLTLPPCPDCGYAPGERGEPLEEASEKAASHLAARYAFYKISAVTDIIRLHGNLEDKDLLVLAAQNLSH